MRNYQLTIADGAKKIFPALAHLGGASRQGDQISFTNYYMEMNKKPFFAICGEFHFSRYSHDRWEDELIKMKMGGINIISTYVFWNHHEEIEGSFDWKENKNIRKFIQLCSKHGLYVILRIGPFAHGEVRNGGMPDWLYGRPFNIRSNDKDYLEYVNRFYQQIAQEISDLLFADNGPIIATQLENEFQHAGSPWELTTGTTNEWLPSGQGGEAHIKILKKMAVKAGIQTPIYTATAWGGAVAPTDEVLPLWGGYAYWPWIFYGDVTEHPATPSFTFRDYHNNNRSSTFDFEPVYQPEDIPFSCAEMGGGMTVFYPYRFKLPYESVDALSLIKVAGGCNFVGYYVYHGGSNPKGKQIPYLNENVTPKISYDYQAPIGEFGQTRASYHRLKRQHLFYQRYQDRLSKMRTILAHEPETFHPEDVETLRFAIREHHQSGFLFINNFQDHVKTQKQNDFSITLKWDNHKLRIPETGSLSINENENAILPFYFSMEGITLQYATTQLITDLEYENERYYFFYMPKGLNGEYCFPAQEILSISIDKGDITYVQDKTIIKVDHEQSMIKLKTKTNQTLSICTMTSQESLTLWQANIKEQKYMILTDTNLLIANETIRLEDESLANPTLKAFPALGNLQAKGKRLASHQNGLFTEYALPKSSKSVTFDWKRIQANKVVIQIPASAFDGVKELLLKVTYQGDIGHAFINGELIHDNFANGDIWEIGLKRFENRIIAYGLYLYITPLKEGVKVNSDSSMAAREEIVHNEIAQIDSVNLIPITEVDLEI